MDPLSSDTYATARKLRELMICHDKAVQQMLLLDSRMEEIDQRFAKQDDYSFPQLKSHWFQRRSMIEWIRDAYDEYRLRKWVEIQMLINYIFAGYLPETIMNVLVLANLNSRSISVLASEDDDDFDDDYENVDDDDDNEEFHVIGWGPPAPGSSNLEMMERQFNLTYLENSNSSDDRQELVMDIDERTELDMDGQQTTL